MFTRIYLGLSGLAFLGYGLYCLKSPEMLATMAGISAQTSTGVTELRAMYGGVQSAVGVVALLGAFKPRWERTALVLLATIFLGLGPTRLASALATSDFSSYSVGGFIFEIVCAGIALLLLRKISPTVT